MLSRWKSSSVCLTFSDVLHHCWLHPLEIFILDGAQSDKPQKWVSLRMLPFEFLDASSLSAFLRLAVRTYIVKSVGPSVCRYSNLFFHSCGGRMEINQYEIHNVLHSNKPQQRQRTNSSFSSFRDYTVCIMECVLHQGYLIFLSIQYAIFTTIITILYFCIYNTAKVRKSKMG